MAREQIRNLAEILRSYAHDPIAVVGMCLVSAAMLAAAQSRSSAAALSLVALLPVCLVVPTHRFWRSCSILVLTTITASAMSMAWSRQMGPMFGLAILAGCVLNALFMVIPAAVCRIAHATKSRFHPLLWLPPAWMLAEILQRLIPPRLSWTLLGMPLGDWSPLAQTASLFGPEFLTFMAISISVCIATWCRQTHRGDRIVALAMGPGLMVLMLLWGQLHINSLQVDSRQVAAGVIQPDVSSEIKADPDRWPAMLEDYSSLIDMTLADRPYLLVLPEMAIPGVVRERPDLKAWIQQAVVRTQRPLIFGTVDRIREDSDRSKNVAVVIPPYGSPIHYEKLRPIPMAEYTPHLWPITDWLQWVREGWPERSAGSSGVVFQIHNDLVFGIMIGQEDIYPDLARDYALDRADFLIVLLNTRRFNGTSQYLQHTRRARLTAVAVGLPMLRCNNSLASQVITSTGNMTQEMHGQSSIGSHRKAAVMNVALATHGTLYRWIGDWGTIAILLVGMAIGLFTGSPARHRLASFMYRTFAGSSTP